MHSNTHKEISLPDADICIVRSRFNEDITQGLLDGAMRVLTRAGIPKERIRVAEVPGSLEIPTGCALFLLKRKPDAIIALGCIVKGETAHDDYIARSVYSALQTLAIEHTVPITTGVLTVNDLEQARVRSGESDMNRGQEAAYAALEMAVLARKLRA